MRMMLAPMIVASLLASSFGTAAGVPQTRLNRLSAGTNVTRWFWYPPEKTDSHYATYLSDSEIQLIRDLGLKHVRLCIMPEDVMNVHTGAINEHLFKYIESAITKFHKHDLAVIVDLHMSDHPAFDGSEEYQRAYGAFWKVAAKRLSKFDPETTYFEIMNEPVFDRNEAAWGPLQANYVKTIRASAPKHTIIASGPNWGGIDGLKKITPVKDSNVVYSFHCYDPFVFTHQGATWTSEEVKPLKGVPYPSSPELVQSAITALSAYPKSAGWVKSYGDERWNAAKLAARFKEGIEWGKRNQVPLYCGEFGVYPVASTPESRGNWFHDFGQVLRDNKIGWSSWGWDDGFGFRREMRNGKLWIDPVVVKSLGLKVSAMPSK